MYSYFLRINFNFCEKEIFCGAGFGSTGVEPAPAEAGGVNCSDKFAVGTTGVGVGALSGADFDSTGVEPAPAEAGGAGEIGGTGDSTIGGGATGVGVGVEVVFSILNLVKKF